MLVGGDDPLGGALLDRMCSVAGCGLEQLCELAVGIAREDLVERRRLLLRLLERTQGQSNERAAKLHDDARISERGTAAGGNAYRTVTAHQQTFDLAIILDRYGE